jgi:hypothetical protein
MTVLTDRDTDIAILERQVWVEELYTDWKKQTLGSRADPTKRVKKKNANTQLQQPGSSIVQEGTDQPTGY